MGAEGSGVRRHRGGECSGTGLNRGGLHQSPDNAVEAVMEAGVRVEASSFRMVGEPGMPQSGACAVQSADLF